MTLEKLTLSNIFYDRSKYKIELLSSPWQHLREYRRCNRALDFAFGKAKKGKESINFQFWRRFKNHCCRGAFS